MNERRHADFVQQPKSFHKVCGLQRTLEPLCRHCSGSPHVCCWHSFGDHPLHCVGFDFASKVIKQVLHVHLVMILFLLLLLLLRVTQEVDKRVVFGVSIKHGLRLQKVNGCEPTVALQLRSARYDDITAASLGFLFR